MKCHKCHESCYEYVTPNKGMNRSVRSTTALGVQREGER
jgi:hypothetical protein